MKVKLVQFFVPLIARKFNAGSSNLCKESFGERVVMLSKLSCTEFVTFEENKNLEDQENSNI